MKRSEQFLSYVSSIAPHAECDDCIAKNLNFPQRQSAYSHGTRLAETGKVERYKRVCHRCGGIKISTSASGSGPALKTKNSAALANNSTSKEVTLLGLSDLKAIGFVKVGLWAMDGDRLSLQLLKGTSMQPALYAFVTKGKLLYIGKTTRELSKRLYHYSRPGPRQSTNIRLNSLLIDALANNSLLEIYAFGDAGENSLGAFSFDIPAALEDDIIRKTQPVWNTRK